MGLIATVGRKSARIRLAIILLYSILSLLALTILYPFALMLSTSFTNRMDYDRFELIPLIFQGNDARFARFLGDRYQESEWGLLEAAYPGISARYWNDIARNPSQFVSESGLGRPISPDVSKFREFLTALPPEAFGLHNLRQMRDKYQKEVVAPLFAELGPSRISPDLPDNGSLSDLNWTPSGTESFRRILSFKSSLPVEYRAVISGKALWLGWLRRNWSVQALNQAFGTQFTSITEVPFLMPGLREQFLEEGVPRRLGGRLPEMDYARFLGSANEWEPLPLAEWDYWVFQNSAGGGFLESLISNYRIVVFYLFEKGHAATNTIILVVLSVFTALTINPLAAYALSRFRLGATPSILLFCLATSAFPAEVAMIPSFLLLRDVGLLNTFAALVLPGAASGFSIFLLKGFFDSLPQELYEAAEIDGAGEIRKFLTITMPLSAPILAVTALGAFTAAYTGYMWAFVVCQDERIWTLMVWLFQFQQEQNVMRSPWIGMAALVVASIPTFIVFLFCQKIIMRGIIIPSMK